MNECGNGIECRSGIVGPKWRLGVEVGMYGALDENCDAVDKGHETVDEACGTVDKGCETVDEGHETIDKGCEIIDKGHDAFDKEDLVGPIGSLVASPGIGIS